MNARRSNRCRTAAFLLMFVLPGLSTAARADGPRISMDPAGNYRATHAVAEFAANGGETALVTAIANGSVVIVEGTMGDGAFSGTVYLPVPDHENTPVIIVPQGASPAVQAAAGLHEWQHIENQDPTLSSSGPPPTDEELQALACREAAAHCGAFHALLIRFLETGLGIPCALKRQILEAQMREAFYCANGIHAIGPPSGPTCPDDPASLPCP